MNRHDFANRACAALVLCVGTAIALPAQTFRVVHSFDGTDGYWPSAALIQATDGNLYGTASFGGASDKGTVFKITRSGTLTTLYNFCSEGGCTDGSNPGAALIPASNGIFYGTTFGGGANGYFGTAFRITTGGTLTTLNSFCSQSGSHP